MSDSPPQPPDRTLRPVLAYRDAAPATAQGGVFYQRTGDTLTITISPHPLATQIIQRTLAFMACAMPTAGMAILILTSGNNLPWVDPTAFCCMAPMALLFAWGTYHTLQRLIHCIREGRRPAVLHASPAGLEIINPDNKPAFDVRLPRDRITSLNVHPGGLGPSVRLILRVTTVDDNLYLVNLPWHAGYPMIAVEDNLRDVLGFLPTN